MTFALLLVCFFLSGFSALLYETAWTRELAFVFGTSELAVVAVLAAYMAGLALGAALAARWAPRIRRPVLAYGLLELGIALWALAVPFAIRAVRGVYLGWLGGLAAIPETLGPATHAFQLLGAFAALAPCTALMGATLPLLARFAVTRDEQIGPRVGLLYAVNTLGAIAGTTAAGFVLLPALGLRATVYVGAAVNALVFGAAAALARRAARCAAPRTARATGARWILPAIALSGAASFGYEVLWLRLLAHVIGTSTAAFSTMLASFLSGIALGSAIASRWARSEAAAATGFAAAQLATAIAAWLGFRACDRLPALAHSLGASVDNLAPGALLGVAMLLPLTLCIGASFPFAVRLLARSADEAAAASARVYAWNTVGAIAGAVGTGYALLPWLGLEGTLVAAAAANAALAALAAARAHPRRYGLAAAAAAVLLALALGPPPRPERIVRASPMGGASYAGPLVYVGVGRSATVALIDRGGFWRLTSNGLPESLIYPPGYPTGFAPPRWLSLLPVLVRPETQRMLIVGLGGGITLAAVPRSVAEIDVIELEPEVVAANRAVPAREGGDPLADPRVSLRVGDARGALTLADARYGAIVSQPSHPWTAGASHLYTREFFALVRSRLAPDGVFVQWIASPFAGPERLRSLVATLNDVFEHLELYLPPGGSIAMVASPAPLDLRASAARALAGAPADFARDGIHRVEDAVAALALDAEGSRSYSSGAPLISDDRNLLAMARAPAAQAAQWSTDALAAHDPLPKLAPTLDVAALTRRLTDVRTPERAQRFASALEPARRELVLGWVALDAGLPRKSRQHFRAALDADRGIEAAAIGIALADRRAAAADLPEHARAVIEARRALELRERDWGAIRALDAELARWQPGELLFEEAAELRVRWRVESGDPRDAADALPLADVLIARDSSAARLLLRARAAARAGRVDLAWITLDALGRSAPPRAVAADARALARELGAPPRGEILQRLSPRARRPAAGSPSS